MNGPTTPAWNDVLVFGHKERSGALGQAQEIVRLLAVGLRLEILIPVAADGHNDVDRLTAYLDIKAPLATIDSNNGFLLGELPASAVSVNSADHTNAFVRVVTVALVDASNLVGVGHGE
jgi:hypothetical protein